MKQIEKLFAHWEYEAQHIKSLEMQAFIAMKDTRSPEEHMCLVRVQVMCRQLYEAMTATSYAAPIPPEMVKEYEKSTGNKA